MAYKGSITSVDVAKEAGCSQALVSYVFSGKWKKANIPEETRDKIMGVAERMGYRPNRLARSLKIGQSHVIGVVAPCVTFTYFSEIIRGAEETLSNNGYLLVLAHSDEDPERERKRVNMLMQYHVDGFLIIPAGMGSHIEVFGSVEKNGLPCVLVDKKVPGLDHPFVGTDDFDGEVKAVQYLVSLGHRRIAFIRGPANVSTAEDRLQGYLHGLREHGLEYDARWVAGSDWSEAQGAAATKYFLTLKPRPTAILACNDVLAWGAYAALAQAGLWVPDDMSVVGFGDVKPSDLLSIPLTTMRQPSREIGRRAAQMLLALLEKKPLDTQQVCLATELIIRRSCCPPSGSDQ